MRAAVDTQAMATWWEQRAARVTQAAEIVAEQTGCSPGEALAQLRLRAEVAKTDLEEVALSVLALQALFDSRAVAAL